MSFRNKSLGKEDRKVLRNQLEVEYRDILEKRSIQQKEQESNNTEVKENEINLLSCMDVLVYDFILYFINKNMYKMDCIQSMKELLQNMKVLYLSIN